MKKSKKIDEAIQLFTEIEKMERTTLGTYHKDYLVTQYELAWCYKEIKKYIGRGHV